MEAWTINLRPLLIAVAIALGTISYRVGGWDSLVTKIDPQIKKYFRLYLGLLCGLFFALATLAKFSQLWTGSLHSQDFWLFEDMLEQILKGGFLLTRFAPQNLGWTQHGAVHGMLSWAFMAPLASILGALNTSLISGPLYFSFAGALLAFLAKKRAGETCALAIAAAFLFSSSVAKIVMYDVHPEAAYPLFLFLWAWALDDRVHWPLLVLSTLGLIWIKEDSFLVLFPWIIWFVLSQSGKKKRAALIAGAIGIAAYAFELICVSNWTSGNWGAHLWQGLPVIIPRGPGLLGGAHWNSLGNASSITNAIIAKQGGWTASIVTVAQFLVSRQWLSLVILFPWIILKRRSWLILLPLAAAIGLLDTASKLWLYYSAPLLGGLWLLAWGWAEEGRFKTKQSAWILLLSLVLGGSAIEIHWPSKRALRIQEETLAYSQCLRPNDGLGLAPSSLLAFLPRERILYDRLPQQEAEWNQTGFAIFLPSQGTFELPEDHVRALENQMIDRKWDRIGIDCRPDPKSETEVRLYLKPTL